jgi:NAD(P)H dehydrogenase (quinone)
MTTFAVTGATGHLGRHVVEQLLEKVPAEGITAVVRDKAKAADLAERGVKLAVADYSAPETFDGLFAAGDKVLLISGSEVDKNRPAQHQVVIDAAKAAGVALLAYTSAPGALSARWPTTTAPPRRHCSPPGCPTPCCATAGTTRTTPRTSPRCWSTTPSSPPPVRAASPPPPARTTPPPRSPY